MKIPAVENLTVDNTNPTKYDVRRKEKGKEWTTRMTSTTWRWKDMRDSDALINFIKTLPNAMQTRFLANFYGVLSIPVNKNICLFL